MAFDLNAFLQENKKFLAAAGLGAGVFFAAHFLVDSFLGEDLRSARAEVASLRAKMGNQTLHGAKGLEAAKTQQNALEATIGALEARLRFNPRPAFRLKEGSASAANQYIGIASEMRERRLDDARARGIDLVDNVGIPERSPTDPEDIRRTLRTLDLVDRVLDRILVPGARSIDRIVLASDRAGERAGKSIREEIRVDFEFVTTSANLSAFLESAQGNDSIAILGFDATSQATSGAGSRGESLVRVVMTVAAFDVALPKE